MSRNRSSRLKRVVLDPSPRKDRKKNPPVFGDEEVYMAMVENIADGIAITVWTERVFGTSPMVRSF